MQNKMNRKKKEENAKKWRDIGVMHQAPAASNNTSNGRQMAASISRIGDGWRGGQNRQQAPRRRRRRAIGQLT
jgi:hypothetical protein